MIRRSRPSAALLLAGGTCLFVSQPATAQSAQPEEIVVTASKTGEDLRKMAGSVSALTGPALDAVGAQSAVDYLMHTPGIVFNAQAPGFSTVTVRGVNTSAGFANLSQGTTGSYINDIPLTDPFFSAGTPDIDTFDVRDIEIYRGPQGTLFGASSLGGAVNYIANRPDLNALDARVETTQSLTRQGDRPNSSYRAMLNAPVVTGKFAVRAVGVARDEAGFLDNVGTGTTNSNETRLRGGRLLAAFEPWDGTRLSWMTLYQQTKNEDAPWQNPDLADLQKRTQVAEPSRTAVLLHNLRFDQDTSLGQLTLLATLHRKKAFSRSDLSRFGRFGFTVPSIDDTVSTHGHTLETRFLSTRGQRFEWLLGAMHDETDEALVENARARNATAVADALLGPGSGGATGDLWGRTTNSFTGKESALFGEASLRLLDGLKLTAGGRLFRTETDSRTLGTGLLYAAFINGQLVSAPQAVRQKEHGFNPKASLSYELTDDTRVYALASKGFRFGGGNVNPDPLLPRTFASDSVWNYEVGIKSAWLDRTLTLDASLFRIDWSGIQLTVNTASGTTGVVNAGNAKIDGAELALGWQPVRGLRWDVSLTWLDAKLTDVSARAGLDFGVRAGARLPATSRWMVAHTLRYAWDLPEKPFVLLSHRHATTAPALLQQFAAPGRNATVGGYDLVDLRGGFSWGSVEVAAFINNVGDERAVLSASYLQPPLANEIHNYVARPRTFGVTLGWRL